MKYFFHSSYPDVPLRNSINRNWMKNSFLLSTMAEKYDHFFMKKLRGNILISMNNDGELFVCNER